MGTRHHLSGFGVGRSSRGPGLALAMLVVGISATASGGDGPAARRPPQLTMAGRTVAQDQGSWVIDYRLRYAGPAAVEVAPERIAVAVEGWVSNSRVPSHAVPRHSSLLIAHGPELTAEARVIAAPDEEHRCREKLICRVSADCGPAEATKEKPAGEGTRTATIRLEAGGVVHVRLRLEHHHVIFGDYDPLLGVRTVEITMAGETVRDVVTLDHEQYLAQPRADWPEPPEERRDTRHSVTGPDSLHLEAHVPGHHYYRYPDRAVRYNTPMRLRFWYLIAAGTEGECRYRVAQYKDTPTSWRMLNEAGFEKPLTVVGRWTKVEHVFNTDAEATTLALDFRIAGDTDIGEMWIDDVRLEPVGCPGHAGP